MKNKTKTVKVNVLGETKEVVIKGLKARELGVILNKFNEIREKSLEDEKVGRALSSLIYLFKENPDAATFMHFMPQMLGVFYDELLDLMTDLFDLTEEEVDDLELEALVELIVVFLKQVDAKKIVDLLGKLATPVKSTK